MSPLNGSIDYKGALPPHKPRKNKKHKKIKDHWGRKSLPQ